MADFVSIEEARNAKKGNIIARVVSLGETKTGTKSDGTQWTRKSIKIQDDSGVIELTAWNDEIQRFELNRTYRLINPFWSIYNGSVQLSLGKYGKVEPATENQEQSGEKPSEPVTLESLARDIESIKEMVLPIFHWVVDQQIKKDQGVAS